MSSSKVIVINQIKQKLSAIINLFNDLESEYEKDVEDKFRIIHFNRNPLELAYKARQMEHERLKKENEKLKVRLQLLESDSELDVTRRIDEVGDRSEQIEILSKRVEELKIREDKLLTSYSKMGREFREVFYLLSGLKIFALRDECYEISNMYAENEADKLFIKLDKNGEIQLLQNEYSDKLTDYIETYLENADSFPAFLAAITLDLFNSTSLSSTTMLTQQETNDTDLSVDMMETTIVPRHR